MYSYLLYDRKDTILISHSQKFASVFVFQIRYFSIISVMCGLYSPCRCTRGLEHFSAVTVLRGHALVKIFGLPHGLNDFLAVYYHF